MNKYVFKPYNTIFPELFEKEKLRLSKFLTGEYKIEHFGSTAVAGLGGKEIIDIYIVATQSDLDRISQEVLSAGYEGRPRVSSDQHIFHKIALLDPKEEKRTYHVHINFPEAEDFKSAIAFRDYLRDTIKSYPTIVRFLPGFIFAYIFISTLKILFFHNASPRLPL